MNRRGVTYDTGVVFSGPGYSVPTRPKLDLATAERELQIARDDLDMNWDPKQSFYAVANYYAAH